MLIVLEGPEAVGKSTQLRRLVTWLGESGIVPLAVREPGGTAVGDELRKILLDPDWSLSARCEALLFMASRAELVHRVLRPALAANRVVIVDRFFLSTYAYQVVGRGLDEADVRAANHLATGGLVPNVTLLLQLPIRESLARLDRRHAGPDRMEQSSPDFHERVAAAFDRFSTEAWQAAHPECGPIRPIDATGSEQQVFGRLRDAVVAAWPGSFPGTPS